MAEFSEDEFMADYELKQAGLEAVLGESADTIGYSRIPFRIDGFGGNLAMHYYPNHIPGTGFATMELLKPDGSGPVPNELGTYEFVAFTKLSYNNPTQEPPTDFNTIERRICDTLTKIAQYTNEREFNPYDVGTVEDRDGNKKYVIFDHYSPDGKEFNIGARQHHLLLCIEIFEEEINVFQMFGGEMFVSMLKMMNFYPYSDLDRNKLRFNG